MTPKTMTKSDARALHVWSLGRVDYADGLAMQESLVALRRAGAIPDVLLLLEHPPTVTLGRAADKTNIVAAPALLARRGVEVHETGRGGDVTFHGPGQLVGYPILDLNPDRRDIRRYMRDLEEALIRTVADFGVCGGRIPGLTGVWIENRKIAALGVRISRWITSHGFALNVTTDLDSFKLIVPCGIVDKDVTSLARETGATPPLAEVEARVVAHFAEVFDREIVIRPVQHHSIQIVLARRVAGRREYLLLRRTPARGGFWQPVTGSIKLSRGETPIDAARREAREETGFVVAPRDLDYVHAFIIDPKWSKKGMTPPIFNREHSFAAAVSDGDVALSPKEHDAFEWLPFDAARERLMWNGNRRAFDLADRALECA